ncbi:MAG: hypothetical protein JW909_13735 [Planctomycetes bacterium]|nr:hypothetical protein [Planctomycetota bacterium]
MLFWRIFCPTCGRSIDHHVWHINTGLGPKLALCPKCNTQVSTGRWEWPTFSGGRRARYHVLSAGYAVLFGILGGGAGELAYRVTPSLAEGSPEMFGVKLFPTILLGVFSTLLVVLVQMYRVKSSRKRSAAGPDTLVKASLFNFQTDLQGKFALLFVLLAIGAVSPWIYRKSREVYETYNRGAQPAPESTASDSTSPDETVPEPAAAPVPEPEAAVAPKTEETTAPAEEAESPGEVYEKAAKEAFYSTSLYHFHAASTLLQETADGMAAGKLKDKLLLYREAVQMASDQFDRTAARIEAGGSEVSLAFPGVGDGKVIRIDVDGVTVKRDDGTDTVHAWKEISDYQQLRLFEMCLKTGAAGEHLAVAAIAVHRGMKDEAETRLIAAASLDAELKEKSASLRELFREIAGAEEPAATGND